MTNKQCKIQYIKDSESNKLLPFQFYNLFDIITLPMIDKKPIIKKWPLYTTTVAPTDINYNIGILTGKTSNLTVLDIDKSDNGLLHWYEISTKYPTINTPTVLTANGALHLYFLYNKKLKSSNRLKINNTKIGWDIKNDKSIVVAPPSILSSTIRRYKWLISPLDTSFKHMPLWLENYILQHSK